MSLEAILEEIRKSGETELAEIETEVQEKEQAILAEAEAEAERRRKQIVERAAREGKQEREHILEHARLQALRIESDAREDLIEETLASARQRLQALREEEQAEYAAALLRLAQGGLAELHESTGRDSRVLLRLDSRDEDRFQNVLEELDGDLETEYDLETWGGLTAASEDGRVVVYNTFEARLDRAMHYLRRTLAAIYA